MDRSSALWGSGGRGGDGRASALWGKGGRGAVLATLVVLALSVPVANASAGPKPKRPTDNYVAPDLAAKAKKHPDQRVRVIIQSSYGTADASKKVRGLGPLLKLGRNLDLVNGVTVDLPAREIDKLAKLPGLTITPDAPVKTDWLGAPTFTALQAWPHQNGDARLWNPYLKDPTIAIVDSGIDASRADFGGRVVANVNLSQLPGNTAGGDGRGHGTFVAGIAAGSARGYAGAAPTADIVALDVMDDQGMALTSDVIAACNWILQHKDEYGIKVANFSLHSTYPSNFGHDPLDLAVEKLWFDGVTVVAAAGNYGNTDGTPSGVRYAPGNDPFVITVGALGLNTGGWRGNSDEPAPWSAYGSTYDGFWKPEIGAVGRYVIGPVPTTATLTTERPDHVTAPGYMELSGTSFAAPVVSGTASALLAIHPKWTPDQVKGALMAGARAIKSNTNHQLGVGEVNAVRSAIMWSPPNPNKALEQFVVSDPSGGPVPVFDAVSWYDAATTDVSWDSVSWDSVSWDSVSWDSVSWDSVSWDSVSWADVSWSDVSWADVSWADSAREDAVDGEPTVGGVDLSADAASAYADDPDLNLDPTLTDVQLADTAGTTDTTTATSP